jgi:predicted permease
MDFRSRVRARLPGLKIPRDAEIVEELAQHLEDLYHEGLDAGLDHAAAWSRASDALPAAADELARALRSAGRTPRGQVADRVRAALDEPAPSTSGAFSMITGLRRDVRYAVRTLVRQSGLTAVIVITLALGIGGTAAVFSAVDAVLLKSVPVAEPDRVVNVFTVWAARATTNPGAGAQLGTSSYPDYVDLRDSGVLGGLATFAGISLTLDIDGITERIGGQVVSGNYFDVTGVRPAAGRAFNPDEDRIGSPARVAVLSHRLWQRRFGGDAGTVGRSITLNGNAYRVIGIAPRGFAGSVLGGVPELWVPMALQEEVRPPSAGSVRRSLGSARLLNVRDARWLSMVGRLKDGASIADTAAALDVVGLRLASAYPESNRDLSATAVPLGDGPGIRTRTRPVLWLLTAAVILVLLIACANVAGLLLARAVTRRREVAVRMAIGAGRAQLVQQWLTEAVILGVLGAAGGLIVARLGTPMLYGFGIPEGVDLGLSSRVFAFTLVTGAGTGLIFGLAPVLQLIRRDTLTALRDEGGSVATGSRATRLRSTFVVLQVALSLVLLVGAGLFLRTVQRAYAVDLGYRVDRMLVAEIEPGSSYSPEAGQAFYSELLGRLNGLPGVVAAGAARVTVLSGSARTLPVSVDGQPLRQDRSNVIPARANVVSEGYFEAMGIPVLRGRGFKASDVQTSPGVVIVSRSLADRLWPDADPIGRILISMSRLEVVGVVPDTVYLSATERDPRPIFYVPLAQNYESGVTLHVRTSGDPLAVLPAVRQIVRDLDSRLVLTGPRRLVDEFDRSMTTARTMATFVGLLSGIALLLAAVGLYGVIAYATRQRTSEVGLRLALGATPASILTMIVLRGARLMAMGAVLGFAGAFAAMRYVRNQLFGVEPTDPLTWLAVFALLLVIGLLACAIPARRAMRIDPAAALRSS